VDADRIVQKVPIKLSGRIFSTNIIILNGQGKGASRPPSGFWCLNDKTIKELMTFAKCEIGKKSYKLH
jgi:hypothetical protein